MSGDANDIEKDWAAIPNLRRFSHTAMAAPFTVFIVHEDPVFAGQAAWAAFDELDRLEVKLSRFVPNSEVSRISSLAASEPVVVTPEVFECLEISVGMYEQTGGVFDITVGSLYECWLTKDRATRQPSKEEVALARSRTGSNLIKLNRDDHTVAILRDGVKIDLGGIGKGYAADKMAALLRQWGIDCAYISAGLSSILSIGTPPRLDGWPVRFRNPRGRHEVLAQLYLRDRAIGASGVEKGKHIIDPRCGRPVEGKIAAWSGAGDAAAADALSTAFMVMSPDEVERYCASHAGILALLVQERKGVLRFGQWPKGTD